MSIVRSIAALVAGYLIMAVIVIAGTYAAAAMLAPEGDPTPAYLTANILLSLAAAIAGGWTCARLAPRSPLVHALVLAALVAVLGFLAEGRPGQAGWYATAIPLIGAAGAALGGWIEGAWRSPARSPTAT